MRIPICLILLFLSFNASSQYYLPHNKVWAFGYHAGLDFNTNPPTPAETGIQTLESSSSIADDDGQLLFYTNGETIYNRQHQPMPNGTGLPPQSSSSVQGSLIIPVRDLYYVFSIPGRENPSFGNLYYSVVDMKRNNGLGDVVPNRKNILISQGNAEEMMAIRGNRCNIWLMVHTRDIGEFKAFEISDTGINTQPVLSTAGNFYGGSNNVGYAHLGAYRIGMMKASPNGKKIAIACLRSDMRGISSSDNNGRIVYANTQNYGLELYDFNTATGTVSNTMTIDTNAYMAYPSLCFSPDNSKLYTHRIEYFHDFMDVTIGLYQYDIGSNNLATIKASKQLIHANDDITFSVTDLKLAPDGRIYCAAGTAVTDTSFLSGTSYPALGHRAMHSIKYPDLRGTACGFEANTIQLLPGTSGNAGLPNEIITYPRDTITSAKSITVCYADSFTIAATHPGGWSFLWDNGLQDSAQTVGTSGTCYIRYKAACQWLTDTFHITFLHLTDSTAAVSFIADKKELCNGQSVSFTPQHFSIIDTLVWDAGDGSGPVYNRDIYKHSYEKAGRYVATLNKQSNVCVDNQFFADTIQVHDFPSVTLGPDTALCPGSAPVVLSNQTTTAADVTYLWNTGSTAPAIITAVPGVYSLTLTNAFGCQTTDSAEIFKSCYLDIPNAFTPDGDGRNDYFIPLQLLSKGVSSFNMIILNRWGEKIFETDRIDSKGWDGRLYGKPQPAGVYIYQIVVRYENGGMERYQGNVTKL